MCAFRAGSFAIFKFLHFKLWVFGFFLKPGTQEGRNMLSVFCLDFDPLIFGVVLIFDFIFSLLLPVPTSWCRCLPVGAGAGCMSTIGPVVAGFVSPTRYLHIAWNFLPATSLSLSTFHVLNNSLFFLGESNASPVYYCSGGHKKDNNFLINQNKHTYTLCMFILT
jgi:hypothetical protein